MDLLHCGQILYWLSHQGSPKVLGESTCPWVGLDSSQRCPRCAPFPGFPLEVQWKSSLQCISEMNRLFSEKTSASKSGWAPPTDVLLDLDTVRELSSGVSRYRDFIRQLPIHLSKYILSMWGLLGGFSSSPSRSLWPRLEVPRPTSCFPGLLDRSTLNRCSFVSQHWAALAQQVKTDLSMRSFIQHQIAFLQVRPVWEGQVRPASFLPSLPVCGGSRAGLQLHVGCFLIAFMSRLSVTTDSLVGSTLSRSPSGRERKSLPHAPWSWEFSAGSLTKACAKREPHVHRCLQGHKVYF